MKKFTIITLMLLTSCQKEINPENSETIMFDNKPVITFTEPYYQLDYIGWGSLLVKQKIGLNSESYTVTDLSRKVVYLTFTGNASGYSNFVEPALPPGVDGSWRKCMMKAIALNSVFHLCANEALAGCMVTWGIYCLWNNQAKANVYPKITRVYLGPLNP